MSTHLQWELIRDSSCYLIRRGGKTFTREPNNLISKNSYKFNGLVHKKSVGVYSGEENKGVVLQYKKKATARKPAEMYVRVVLNSKNPRKVYRTIRKLLGTQNYRRDLIGLAVRRASVLLHQQRPKKRLPSAAPTTSKK